MEIESPQKGKIFIPLLSSKSKIEEYSNFRYCLIESILHNNEEKSTSNIEFKISNFNKILSDPFSSPSNLVINEPYKIVTELESLHETDIKLIIDITTGEKQKIDNLKKMELEGKVKIGVCYLPKFENISKDDKEIRLIMDPRRILKKIEHEAFDTELCFTGIGVFSIRKLIDPSSFESMMFQGVKDFVQKHGSPVVIDIQGLNSDDGIFEWVLKNIEESLRPKFLFVNFSFEFEKKSEFFNGVAKEITEFRDYSSFRMYLESGFKTQLKLFDFVRERFSVENVCKIIEEITKDYHSNVILTPGVEFKTDLSEYGGLGFGIINEIYEKIQLQNELRSKLFRDNLTLFFNWWLEKEKKAPKGKSLKCTTCGFVGYDETKWFSKNGLFFEKPACFKKYLNFLKEKGIKG